MPSDPKPLLESTKSDKGKIISSMEGLNAAVPHPTEEGDPYASRRLDRLSAGAKPTFTAQEIGQIKRLLEEAANEPPESSETEAVIGTLSDKIDSLRSSGMNNDAIGALLTQVTGATITGDQLAQFYASPQGR